MISPCIMALPGGVHPTLRLARGKNAGRGYSLESIHNCESWQYDQVHLQPKLADGSWIQRHCLAIAGAICCNRLGFHAECALLRLFEIHLRKLQKSKLCLLEPPRVYRIHTKTSPLGAVIYTPLTGFHPSPSPGLADRHSYLSRIR